MVVLVHAFLAATWPVLAAAEPLCGPSQVSRLTLATAEGTISIELFEDAAPRTLPRVVRLVEDGTYDGLPIDYTRPQVEIVTADPPTDGEPLRFPMEIDAEVLGLDEDLVKDPGEAMDLMQEKLLEAWRDGRETGEVSELLEPWIAKWYENRTAEFLVGTSRKDVNTALGYVYESGPASRPVTRGAVVLKNDRPGLVTPRLGIVLTDVPDRTGLWMVIGRVTGGLETAMVISKRPLLGRHAGGRFAPVEPVVVESLRFACEELP